MSKPERTDTAFGIVPFRIENGKPVVLLIQHNAGHWAFPKGHAEGDESAEASARRELFEETGIQGIELLKPDPIEEYYEIKSKKWLTRKTVWFFVGITTDAEVICQEEEVQAYEWLSVKKATKRLTFDASRETLQKAECMLARQLS